VNREDPLRNLLQKFYISQVQIIVFTLYSMGSRDSVVSIATGYGLDDRGVGVRASVGSRNFSAPRRPDRFWGPPSRLSNEYRGLFPRG
jgi:hypothetical protein